MVLRLCRVCKEFHSLDGAWPQPCSGHFGEASDGKHVNIISDTMGPIRSMADGRMYDSKSQYYRSVKAAGCEITGNEKPQPRVTPRPRAGHDIKRAIQQLGG